MQQDTIDYLLARIEALENENKRMKQLFKDLLNDYDNENNNDGDELTDIAQSFGGY